MKQVNDFQSKEGVQQIFISYASEDRAVARRLYNDLAAAGLTPWLDTERLLPGQRWADVIADAIQHSSHFIVLLSSKSVSKRGFVQKELKIALDVLDQFPDSEIFVIPVRIDDCSPANIRLRELHWVDLWPSYENGLKALLHVLTGKPPRKQRRKSIAFDQTHGQEKWDWGGAVPILQDYGYQEVGAMLRKRFNLNTLQGATIDHSILAEYAALIIVSPYHMFFQPTEIALIESFVRNGGGLLLLGFELADKHHKNNLSLLASRFGIQFNYDRVVNELSYRGTPLHPLVKTDPSFQPELCNGVKYLCLPLACSLKVAKPASVVVRSGSDSFTECPSLIENGLIKRFKQTTYTNVPVVAKASIGRGKVIAVGSWEIFLTHYLKDKRIGNRKFFLNIIQWLIKV